MITDMTQGKPFRVLWRFTIPMLVSVMFQQFYNIVDSIVAGKFVGVDALAAVGASYPVTMIFMAVATGLNIGCSVVILLYFGAKEYGRMKCCVSTSLISTVGIAVVLSALGFLFSRPLMRLMNTPENIFSDSALYLNIYIGGLVFLFLYNICTGVFIALGDSRTPLYFLIRFLCGKYCAGPGVCHCLSHGRCRCGLGYISCAGYFFPAGLCDADKTTERNRNTRGLCKIFMENGRER